MTTHDTRQDADERRAAHYLRRAGVGPDAATDGPDWFDRLCDWQEAEEQPATAPAPRIPLWWEKKTPLTAPVQPAAEEEWQPILTDGRTPAPAPAVEPAATEATGDEGEEPEDRPRPFAPAPGYWPHPHWPAVPEKVASVAISPKTRAGLYNIAAAGAGYLLGLAPLLHGWIVDCGHGYSIAGAVTLGVGGCLAVAHLWDRRTRLWWGGLAWAARIPLASAVLALGLYAPLH